MTDYSVVNSYLNEALNVFKSAGIVLPKEATVNIYHHRGSEFVYQVGALFINVVNREYCKNYVVMLPNQEYPMHHHVMKTESCYVLYGNLFCCIDGRNYELSPGEIIHIGRGQNHSFRGGGVDF